MQFPKQPFIIAHRGASAYAPENTVSAFKIVERCRAAWVEFDVMLTADGVPVVFHDETLLRTTQAHGQLHKMTYDQLSKLDAGSWFSKSFTGEPIPTLSAVLDVLSGFAQGINVEIKSAPGLEEDTIIQVMSCVAQNFRELPIWYSSFSSESMDILSSFNNIQRGCLFHHWDENWLAFARAWECVSVHINESVLTESHVKEVTNAGYTLLSYTVNNPRRAHELFSWGVSGVFSDYPDLLSASNEKLAN